MAIRTGKQYIESLRDSRQIFIRGEKVRDLPTHASFSGIVSTIARLYDLQHETSNLDLMTYSSEGQRYGNIFTLVKKPEDIKKLRSYSTVWANETAGLLGRAPDYCSALTLGLYNMSPLLQKLDSKFAKNAMNYYYHCRDNDLALSHVITSPQIDRSKGPIENGDVRVIDENENGIVVDGARMLATFGAVANEILVYPGQGQSALGEPERDSVSAWFAVPLSAPGLKLLCREDYARARSNFDHPLATVYDESDALVIFDHVVIPWDKVFIAGKGSAKMSHEIMSRHLLGNWASYTALVRSLVKLKFFLGACFMLTDHLGLNAIPHIQEKLGEMAIYVGVLEDSLVAIEHSLVVEESGLLNPAWSEVSHPRVLLSIHVWPRIVELLRVLGAS